VTFARPLGVCPNTQPRIPERQVRRVPDRRIGSFGVEALDLLALHAGAELEVLVDLPHGEIGELVERSQKRLLTAERRRRSRRR
jgi:hypothetical protein